MKKNLIFLCLLKMQYVFAQPILTQFMLVPVIGDTYVLYDRMKFIPLQKSQ